MAAARQTPRADESYSGRHRGAEVVDVVAMVHRFQNPPPIDEQILDAAERLRDTKTRNRQGEDAIGALREPPGPGQKWRPRSSTPGDDWHLLKLLEDPQFVELMECAEMEDGEEGEQHPLRLDWRRKCRKGIRALLEQFRMTQNPKLAERQLRQAYRWYKLQAGAFASICASSVQGPCTPAAPDASDPSSGVARLPGSSCHSPSEAAASARDGYSAASPLASARERLKDSEARQPAIHPATSRFKGHHGGLAVRSAASTPPGRACRPASAQAWQPPLNAQGGLALRPRTVLGLCSAGSHGDAFARRPPTPAEVRMEERWLERRNLDVIGQITGEERHAAIKEWSERRARVEEEIARNAEVSRFQSDLQSRSHDLPLETREDVATPVQGPVPPCGARGPAPHRRPSSAGARTGAGIAPSRIPAAPQASDDCSTTSSHVAAVAEEQKAPAREELQVRFAQDPEVAGEDAGMGSKPPTPRPAPLTPRLAQLRKIHAKILQRPEISSDRSCSTGTSAREVATLSPKEEAAVPAVNPMAAGSAAACRDGQQVALSTVISAKMPDETDVVAGPCNIWRQVHGAQQVEGGTVLSHQQMRYQQLMEVEQVKRLFARTHTPVDEAALENALVAPARGFQEFEATPLSTKPNLMKNPFAEDWRKRRAAAKTPRRRRRSGGPASRGSPARRRSQAAQPRARSAQR